MSESAATRQARPDPKPTREKKQPRRRRDPLAVKQAALSDRECWGCGREGANGHHLIPKDFEKPCPDVDWNIIALCGSGTSGCHGAFHGNPYTPARGERITPTLVRYRIAFRLTLERPRLREVWDYLGSNELRERFFRRVLDMSARDFEELQRRRLL